MTDPRTIEHTIDRLREEATERLTNAVDALRGETPPERPTHTQTPPQTHRMEFSIECPHADTGHGITPEASVLAHVSPAERRYLCASILLDFIEDAPETYTPDDPLGLPEDEILRRLKHRLRRDAIEMAVERMVIEQDGTVTTVEDPATDRRLRMEQRIGMSKSDMMAEAFENAERMAQNQLEDIESRLLEAGVRHVGGQRL